MIQEDIVKKCGKYYMLKDFKSANKETVQEIVRLDGRSLSYAKDVFKDDEEIILTAVKSMGTALQYASDRLKDNREAVLVAVQNNGMALEYASDRLKRDPFIITEAIKKVTASCRYSLLKEYKELDWVFENGTEEFLQACYHHNKKDRAKIAKAPNFAPTLQQLENGLNSNIRSISTIFHLRRDEWLAKLEENKLKDITKNL